MMNLIFTNTSVGDWLLMFTDNVSDIAELEKAFVKLYKYKIDSIQLEKESYIKSDICLDVKLINQKAGFFSKLFGPDCSSLVPDADVKSHKYHCMLSKEDTYLCISFLKSLRKSEKPANIDLFEGKLSLIVSLKEYDEKGCLR